MGNCCCGDTGTEGESRRLNGGQRLGGGGGGGQRLGGGGGRTKAFSGAGHSLGGGGVGSESGVAANDAAAVAAMSRQAQGVATPKDRALEERRVKDDIIGKIYAAHSSRGSDPPIGLPTCNVEQLKRHLDKVRGMGKGQASPAR